MPELTRSASRWLPALVVTLLLAFALLGPSRKVNAARPVEETDYLYYPNCTWVTEGGLGNGTAYPIPDGEGITQPLGAANNFATSILGQEAALNSAGRFDVVYWDPAALAPAAGYLTLRSRSFEMTVLMQNESRQDFFPPVITKALTSVAEPPPTQFAIEQRALGVYLNNYRTVTLVADDASSLPAALQIHTDGSRTTLPGTHPVFWHEVCGGDATLQNLRVLQCVMKTDEALTPVAVEYVQKFRLPAAGTVRWIELAFAAHYPNGQLDWGRVRIVDADGQSTPPTSFANPLVDAQISVWAAYSQVGHWDTHLDLSSFPTLQPNHDYWLVVNPVGDYWFFAKALHGNESPYFTTAIGPLWRRDSPGAEGAILAGHVLSFRIIGTPTGTVGVTPVAPLRAGFALEVSPNPAHGATSIAWAGAKGGVRFEVLDARGRRVASGANAAGAEGRWSFTGAGDDGRALPAGVYFVRARDESGRSTSARLVLVR